ncbi:MAG: molybdopterin-dependent oxidoreductase [bacterium]|nr:molybdopterin-dependent oxidoreductase [bacterium]
MSVTQTHYRTCPLCEATCGLEITTTDDGTVQSVRGDKQDVLSGGFLCTKGLALGELHADPDRLRSPLIRDRSENGDGRFREASWDEAFAHAERGLREVIEQHGRESLGIYLGNPNTHNPGLYFYTPALIRAMRTRHIYSASSVDQLPKQLSSALIYGLPSNIAVPDIDRCDYMIMLGANPYVSNGSLWTAPDVPGRVKALKARGGRLVVIDPAYTITAKNATEHIPIKPGGDAFLLAGMVHTLFDEGLVAPGRLADQIQGLDDLKAAFTSGDFAPESVSSRCAIPAETIRRLARELAALRSQGKAGTIYSRIGSCTQEFGTISNWLVDVLNILTGNLDEAGGSMFPRPASAVPNHKPRTGNEKGYRGAAKKTSRVRGLPAVFGEYPASCLPEEILTPGTGQIRAMFTLAGNPAVSTPDSQNVQKAFADLEFMISVDMYVTETTRHADVIFPALSHLEDSHFDFIFSQFMIRNVANYSPAVFEKSPDHLYEWEILLRLTGILSEKKDPGSDLNALDDIVLRQWMSQLGERPQDSKSVEELMPEIDGGHGPERIIDYLVRSGPYGEGFGKNPDGLSLRKLREHPHGIDCGALAPRLPDILRTASGKIEIAPELLIKDTERLKDRLKDQAGEQNGADFPLMLIGRRHIKSNNSWMHNIERLVKGEDRTALFLHPDDAKSLGVSDGRRVRVASRVGELETVAKLTEGIMPGVVSLPHGWKGQANTPDAPDAGVGDRRVVAKYPGVNKNILTDPELYDRPSGNAVLDGIPVQVSLVS